MRFLHLSDLHLGRRLGERDLWEDQAHILKQLTELAVRHRADGVIIAGDVYERAAPSAGAVALFDEFLTGLSAAGLSVYIVSGNHDSAQRLGYASRLLASKNIHLASVFEGGMQKLSLQDAYGPLDLWLLPFFRLGAARRYFAEEDLPDATCAVRRMLEAADCDYSRRNALVRHQFVTAGGTAPGQSDSESVQVGTLENVDAAVLEGFDYVALGHIHGPQRMGSDRVRYAGSPLKYSASEALQEKSVPLVTLKEKGELEVELLPLCPLRDLRRIEGELEQLLQAAVPSEDYIQAVLTDPAAPAGAANRLRAYYPNLVGVEQKQSPYSAQGARLTAQRLRGRTPLALFGEFYEKQLGVPMDEAECALIEALLQGEEVEE